MTDEAKIITVPAQLTFFGRDGYTNPLAGLGSASLPLSSGYYERSDLSCETEKLSVFYRECSLAKRIIDMPCEDMTRAWYTLSSAKVDETDLRMIRELEAKHNVKQEITNGIRWGRLYGGSLAIIVIEGQEEQMDQPLDLDRILPGSYKGLYIADLTQGITPSMELEDDLDDPDYGLPQYYEVNFDNGEIRSARIHHSRVLRFTGRELPHTESVRNNYWGASELEHSMDEINRYTSIRENICQLAFRANLITLKIGEVGTDLAYGSDRLLQSIEQAASRENKLRTSYGVQIMGKDDSMETHSYNFAGMAEIMEASMMDVAGAAEIPAAILFGRAPQGMNATGEMDLRNYYDKIGQLQERILRPALEKLVPVMAMSCWGFVPDDLKISFNPVVTISPAEKAKLSMGAAQEVGFLYEKGLISKEQALRELSTRGAGIGTWGSLA